MKEAIRKAEDTNFKEAVSRAEATREAAMHNVPRMKMEPQEFRDGHTWLANECRRSPVDVDTDVASHGWTNWEVKKEPLTKFAHLPVRPSTRVIELDTPSPAKRPRVATSLPSLPSMPSCPVMNPSNAELGLPDNDDSEVMDLEMALEEMMDQMDGMPRVGEAPDED